MKIVFAGSPAVAVPALESLLKDGFDVVGVMTRPAARTGRGRTLQETPVAAAARAADIPVLETSNPSDPDSLSVLRGWEPQLGVVVAYGAILRQDVLDLPDFGWVNLHFSDLPRWRGAAPVQWAIRSGDDRTATCVFQLERGLDTGPVFSKRGYELSGSETSGELLEVLAQQGAAQVSEVAAQIARGTATSQDQPSEGVTTAPRLEKADGYIDFRGSASDVHRVVRSVIPSPGAWTLLPSGDVLKLGPVTVAKDVPGLEAGMLASTKKAVTVQCEQGAVELGRVAPAGKKWMDAAAWIRGARLEENARLGGAGE